MPSCITPVTNTNVQSSATPGASGANSSESFVVGNPLGTSNPRPSLSGNPSPNTDISTNNPSGSGSFNGVEFPNATNGVTSSSNSNGTTISSDLVLTIGNPLATASPNVSPSLTPQVSSTNNLRLSYYDYFSAELKWQPVAGADSYRLYQDGQLIADNLTNFMYYVKNLRPNTNYTFDLVVVNNGIESNKSTVKMRTYIPSTNTSNNYIPPVYYPTPSPTPSPDLSNVIFVKKSSDDNGDNINIGDGKSWATAYTDLQEALSLANLNGKQIWVAKGTYYPTSFHPVYVIIDDPSPRDKSFVIPAGVKIYGGFAGTETSITSRNISVNPTILSGDFLNNDSGENFIDGEGSISELRQDNSNNVVKISDDGGTPATLDGLTITGGYDSGNMYLGGGGLNIRNAWPVINNVTFLENYSSTTGGGINMSAESQNSNRVRISNSKFINNRAGFSGGGIYYSFSTFSIANSSFSENYAGFGGNSIANCDTETTEYTDLGGNNIDSDDVVTNCGA
ncbi:hypothetical protein EON78_03510 [bacterium]|nr:MAG: hypothetical protein EON78_03510 [bacterium]